MKRKILRITLIVAICVAAGLAYLSQPPDVPDVDYSQSVFVPHAITLAKGVHFLGELAPGAGYVVETEDGLILIDTGIATDASSVIPQLSDLGLKVEDLKYIFLTHVHADHTLGAKRLRQMSGAKVLAGVRDREFIERGEPYEALFSTFEMPGDVYHGTKVDVALSGGEEFELGTIRLTAIATPGHTPGSMCFLLESNGERILFTGDTISSLTGDIGTYVAHLSARYRGDPRDYLMSLKKLRDMPPPNLVLPGHPMAGGEGQSPRMKPSDWQALLDRGIDEMNGVLERHQNDGRDFLDGHAKPILPGLYYLGNFEEHALYGMVDNETLYLFDPLGKGIAEFFRKQCAQQNIEFKKVVVFLTAPKEQFAESVDELAADFELTVIEPDSMDVKTVVSFPLQQIEVAGFPTKRVVYQFDWHDKSVIVTGRAVSKITQDSAKQLAEELLQPGADLRAYLKSLDALKQQSPDVWLPASPIHDQNANLYGTQWRDAIEENRKAFFQSR